MFKLIKLFKILTFREISFLIVPNYVLSVLKFSREKKELIQFLKSIEWLKHNNFYLKRVNKEVLSISSEVEKNYIRRHGSDLIVFKQIFVHEEYKKVLDLVKVCGLQNTFLNIIDCGSNVGLFSSWMLKRVNVRSIISIESDFDNYSFQKHFFLDNNKEVSISLLNKAVWSISDVLMEVGTDFRDGDSWSRRVKESFNVLVKEPLMSISLDQILNDFDLDEIHILKIDIEGAEKELFQNLENFEIILKKTWIIAIEVHEEVLSFEFVFEILERYGFHIETIGETTFGHKNVFHI